MSYITNQEREEIMARGPRTMRTAYKIVQMVGGRMVETRPLDITAWAEVNGRETYYSTRVSHLRPELRNQPKVRGMCGPMYDGLENGLTVVRYEDSITNDVLSR